MWAAIADQIRNLHEFMFLMLVAILVGGTCAILSLVVWGAHYGQ